LIFQFLCVYYFQRTSGQCQMSSFPHDRKWEWGRIWWGLMLLIETCGATEFPLFFKKQ
jgi:hypothetical protein